MIAKILIEATNERTDNVITNGKNTKQTMVYKTLLREEDRATRQPTKIRGWG